VIYDLRLFALEGGEDLKGEIWETIEQAARATILEYAPEGAAESDWDLAGLRRRLLLDFFVVVNHLPETEAPDHDLDRAEIEDAVLSALKDAFHRKLESLGPHAEAVAGFIMLSVIDDKWKDHLYDLDHLKASIGFRGWGQKDPLVEYKKEAYDMFVDLMADLRKTVASFFYRAQIGPPPQARQRPPQRLAYSGPSEAVGSATVGERAAVATRAAAPQRPARPVMDELGVSTRANAASTLPASGPDPRELATNRGEERQKAPVSVAKEPGRNDPCPCGSGKKYKKCHGA
jgi:preprotein translocase subunit SecA